MDQSILVHLSGTYDDDTCGFPVESAVTLHSSKLQDGFVRLFFGSWDPSSSNRYTKAKTHSFREL